MKKVALFLANGFEEIEALGTIDILRRAQIPLKTVSITNDRNVTGLRYHRFSRYHFFGTELF